MVKYKGNKINKMSILNVSPTIHWYKTWWGIILLILMVFFLVILGWVGYIMYDSWQKAQSGEFNLNAFDVSGPPPYNMDIIIDPSDPVLGDARAEIKIVEFGDFLCPVCQKSYSVIRELQSSDPRNIRVYWRNVPVIAEDSIKYMVAGECAHLQGKFWAFHDRMFQLQDSIQVSQINALAQQIGLDMELFRQCYNSDTMLNKIRYDMDLAERLGVKGTPTFFVNGYVLSGYVPLEVWKQILSLIAN